MIELHRYKITPQSSLNMSDITNAQKLHYNEFFLSKETYPSFWGIFFSSVENLNVTAIFYWISHRRVSIHPNKNQHALSEYSIYPNDFINPN